MVLNNARPKINQTSFGGFQLKMAKIQQVIPEKAIAVVIDDLKQQHEVPLNVQRSKGLLPKENEIWYLEKVMNQWLFSAFVASTYDDFIQYHLVTVNAIDGEGKATATDSKGRVFTLDTFVQRSKGSFPSIGETWYIDNLIGGKYTFAAYVYSDSRDIPAYNSWIPVPLESGIVNGGISGTGTFGFSPEFMVCPNPLRVHLRGILRKGNGSNFAGTLTLGTMPAYARPTQLVQLVATGTNTGTSVNTGRVDIAPTGIITLRLPGTYETVWTGIDNNHYFLD